MSFIDNPISFLQGMVAGIGLVVALTVGGCLIAGWAQRRYESRMWR